MSSFRIGGVFPVLLLSIGLNFPGQCDDHGDNALDSTPIPIGDSIPGVIEVEGDNDWFAFAGVKDARYILATSSGTLEDTVLYLIDSDGQTEIAYNDDYEGLSSRIDWICPIDGTYYAVVQGYSTGTGSYSLNISGQFLSERFSRVRELLENNQVHVALTECQDLLKVTPKDAELNFYTAFLRLLDIVESPDQRLSQLLEAFGVSTDLLPDPYFQIPSPLPESAPSLNEVQFYANQVLIPAIQESLVNLDRVAAASGTSFFVANLLDPDSDWFEVDAGDALIAKGGLLVVLSMIDALSAFNMDIDANTIETAVRYDATADEVKQILDLHPQVGSGNEEISRKLNSALNYWLNASQALRTGIQFKLKEREFQGDDLFSVDPEEGKYAISGLILLDRVFEGLAGVCGGDLNADKIVGHEDLYILKMLWHTRP